MSGDLCANRTGRRSSLASVRGRTASALRAGRRLWVELRFDGPPGDERSRTVIVLRGARRPAFRFAASDSHAALLPAFRALHAALGRGIDRTLTDAPLPNGGRVRVHPVPLLDRRAGSVEAAPVRRGPDTLVFEPHRYARPLFLGAIGVGAALMAGAAAPMPLEWRVALVLAATPLFFSGLAGMLLPLDAKRLTIDRSIGGVRRLSGLHAGQTDALLAHVAAVQVCGGGRDRYFELNLVLRRPLGARCNVLRLTHEERLRENAAALAGFVGVPILDHASRE